MSARTRVSTSGAAALGVLSLSLVSFAALQYVMPPGFQSPPGLNPDGVLQFQQILFGHALPPLSETVYVWAFRLLLALAWASYAWVILEAMEGRIPRAWSLVAIVIGLSIIYAVLCPPSLSRDGYAYVAFGRMGVLYGLSPYAHTLKDLIERGDEAARFYPADVSSTYGPLWTLVSYAVVTLTRGTGLWGQVVAFKLLGAASTIGAAFAGGEIARRYEASPASPAVVGGRSHRAGLAFLAIGLNPLMVVEGPGNGHNDLLMMALLLAGLAYYTRGRPWAGYLLMGCSAAIKFLGAAIVPWVLMDQVRGLEPRKAVKTALVAGGLVLLPGVLSYLPLQGGGGLVTGASRVYGLQQGGSVAMKAVVLIVLYLGLTLALLRGGQGRFLAAWVVFASALAAILMPVLFAWYVVWPLSVSLARWDSLHRKLTFVVSLVACWLLMLYSIPLRP